MNVPWSVWFSSSVLPHLATVAFTSVGGRQPDLLSLPRHCTSEFPPHGDALLEKSRGSSLVPFRSLPKSPVSPWDLSPISPVILYGPSLIFCFIFLISVYHQVIYIIINYREYFLFYHWDVSPWEDRFFSLGQCCGPITWMRTLTWSTELLNSCLLTLVMKLEALNSAFLIVMSLLNWETLPKELKAQACLLPSYLQLTLRPTPVCFSPQRSPKHFISVTNGLPTTNPIQKFQSLLDL